MPLQALKPLAGPASSAASWDIQFTRIHRAFVRCMSSELRVLGSLLAKHGFNVNIYVLDAYMRYRFDVLVTSQPFFSFEFTLTDGIASPQAARGARVDVSLLDNRGLLYERLTRRATDVAPGLLEDPTAVLDAAGHLSAQRLYAFAVDKFELPSLEST